MNLTLDQKHRLLVAAKHDLLHTIGQVEKVVRLRGEVSDAEITLSRLEVERTRAVRKYQEILRADNGQYVDADEEPLLKAQRQADADYQSHQACVTELQRKLKEALSNLSMCGAEHSGSVHTASQILLNL